MVPVEEEEEDGAEEEVVEEEGGKGEEAIKTTKEDNKITKIAKITPIPQILVQILTQIQIVLTLAVHVIIRVIKNLMNVKVKALTFPTVIF